MRVSVRQLGGKTPFVFDAYASLQRVVVRIGLVFFLRNAGEAGVVAQFVRKDFAALVGPAIRVDGGPVRVGGREAVDGLDDRGRLRRSISGRPRIVWIVGQRQCVDGARVVLIPSCRTDILHGSD